MQFTLSITFVTLLFISLQDDVLTFQNIPSLLTQSDKIADDSTPRVIFLDKTTKLGNSMKPYKQYSVPPNFSWKDNALLDDKKQKTAKLHSLFLNNYSSQRMKKMVKYTSAIPEEENSFRKEMKTSKINHVMQIQPYSSLKKINSNSIYSGKQDKEESSWKATKTTNMHSVMPDSTSWKAKKEANKLHSIVSESADSFQKRMKAIKSLSENQDEPKRRSLEKPSKDKSITPNQIHLFWEMVKKATKYQSVLPKDVGFSLPKMKTTTLDFIKPDDVNMSKQKMKRATKYQPVLPDDEGFSLQEIKYTNLDSIEPEGFKQLLKRATEYQPVLPDDAYFSWKRMKTTNLNSIKPDDVGSSSQKMKRVLAVARKGRPNLYIKSDAGHVTGGGGGGGGGQEYLNTYVRGHFGLSRYSFDRPRPLRWG